MRNKVHDVLKVVGRDSGPMVGKVIYHAADGATDGGKVGADRRHSMRKALHKQRMRASGMTDDIFGAKEVGGSQQNKYENETPEPRN